MLIHDDDGGVAAGVGHAHAVQQEEEEDNGAITKYLTPAPGHNGAAADDDGQMNRASLSNSGVTQTGTFVVSIVQSPPSLPLSPAFWMADVAEQ